MKSRRHKNNSAPFSLFSFQDIITGISGIMIFVLLILSLELTMPEEEKEAEEENRRTLFAQDPMEVFVAGKLEIANSHTVLTKDDLLDLYLQEGEKYFQIDESKLPPVSVDQGAAVNPSVDGQTPASTIDPITGNVIPAESGSTPAGQGNSQVAGIDPVSPNPSTDPAPPAEEEPQNDPLKNAFKWFGEEQNANGSWDQKHVHGITGLVVMAYLSYRERTGNTEFDDALQNGLEFLIQDKTCKPGADKFAYQNGIKTLALTEAARVLGSNPRLEKAIKDSVTYIIVGQQDGGGFYYNYNTKTKTQDLSVAAWNLQAMDAAAKLYDIELARQGVEKAKPWLTAMSKKHFTYNTKNHEASDSPTENHRESMRAIGTWLTLALNKDNYENIKDDLEGIVAETYEGLSWKPKVKHPLYCWNYATMAMMVAGGENRQAWKTKINDLLLENQTSSGYWKPLKFRHGSKPFYTTAFCAHILALVYDYKDAAYNGPPKGISVGGDNNQPPPTPPPVANNNSVPENPEPALNEETPKPTEEIAAADPKVEAGAEEENNPETGNTEESASEEPEGDAPAGEFDNLISLDKGKAQEIKKRLNVFRRSIKSDPEVRKALEEKDLEALNEAIVKSLNKKYFLEAQLNKMNKDPYIHDQELLKDRYIHLNKEVTKLMKKIHQYETSNSDGLALSPINVFVGGKDIDIQLSDGQNIRFSTSVDGLKDFQTFLQSKDPLKDVLMINIKPSGVGVFRKIDDHIELLNFKNLTTPVDENMGAK